MECNKEEALRAKEISQRKMESSDFPGARKFALKAQQLYPDMENISQMICVCDVHCSADSKILGTEFDWYGILQIEQTADDTLIKKQYRKFALLLHPDKNKFSGAEAAFKLIGEAQRVLLDKEKRLIHDMKRKAAKPVRQNQPPQQASRNVNVVKTSRAQNNSTNNMNSHAKDSNARFQESKQQAQSGVSNGRETFWTQCPYCGIRYQYHGEVLNRALRCQTCKKPFIAYDVNFQGAKPGNDATQHVFPGQNIPNMKASNPGSDSMKEKYASNTGFHTGKNALDSPSKKVRQSYKVDRQVEQGSKSSRKINDKKVKKQVESSESFGSDSSLESEEVELQSDMAQQFESDGDASTRRSSRNKRHVSYNEQVSDDEEIMNPLKKAKESGPSNTIKEEKVDAAENKSQPDPAKIFVSASATFNESKKGECNKSDGNETMVDSTNKSFEADDDYVLTSSRETTPEPQLFEYADPEFFDFDKQREEKCFKVGQVWAAYDTADAMPRFYAKIRKVYSPGFKLRITWLEANPDDPCWREWVNSDLPFSCGKFKLGSSDDTEDRLMFSHEVTWEKGITKNSVLIYPRKGEIWALFKKWDAKWYLIPENDRKFDYEFVEVLSEFDVSVGIRVALLGKLKGFASLFFRRDESEMLILPSEVLKFSHMVPSYGLSGNEREGVPKDSFELDPASITPNLDETAVPQSNGNTCSVNFSGKFEEVNTAKPSASYHDGKSNQVLHRNNLNGDVKAQGILDLEFFNFGELKSVSKFKVNQVWALYSDTDGLPKNYGLIKRIDHHPHFMVQIAWLEPFCLQKQSIFWKEIGMPITCGEFRVNADKMQTYDDLSSFSHKLNVDTEMKKSKFYIYPQKGEVWALYENWDACMKVADLQNCDYDIVEIVEEFESCLKVLVLERVKDFHSVFRPRKNGGSADTRDISRHEFLRFSHQIPSFRLTDANGGNLQGFWKLDPAAFPARLLYKC